MSCSWWKIISGSTMAPTVLEANSTLAMGTPLIRLFLEPQNTSVISSSLVKPSARAFQVVSVSTRVSSIAQSTSRPASAGSGVSRHRPLTTAALKAEYTTSRMEP